MLSVDYTRPNFGYCDDYAKNLDIVKVLLHLSPFNTNVTASVRTKVLTEHNDLVRSAKEKLSNPLEMMNRAYELLQMVERHYLNLDQQAIVQNWGWDVLLKTTVLGRSFKMYSNGIDLQQIVDALNLGPYNMPTIQQLLIQRLFMRGNGSEPNRFGPPLDEPRFEPRRMPLASNYRHAGILSMALDTAQFGLRIAGPGSTNEGLTLLVTPAEEGVIFNLVETPIYKDDHLWCTDTRYAKVSRRFVVYAIVELMRTTLFAGAPIPVDFSYIESLSNDPEHQVTFDYTEFDIGTLLPKLL